MASGIKKSKAPKKEKEVTLEQVLWNCRVALRGFGSFEKNRDSVIGLAFLKFAGDKFEKRRKEIIAEYGDILRGNGFHPTCLFRQSTILLHSYPHPKKRSYFAGECL